MKILMVSAELAPFAKTGGLADSVAGLSTALAAAGHDVCALLPQYAHLAGARAVRTLDVHGSRYRFRELESERRVDQAHPNGGRARVLLLELGELTAESIYTGDARDGARFLRLAAAAAAFAAGQDWRADVIHCHDWHAALTPAFLRRDSALPSVLTLHNVGYQGVFAEDGLPEHDYAEIQGLLPSDTRSGGSVNFLRAGIRAADRVTTVSPTYAAEILQPEFGMGLEDALGARGADLVGILNGVDYGIWSPDSDPFFAERYDAADLAPKRRIKGRLLGQLDLNRDIDAPLVGVVSRLAAQKGIDLVAAILPTLLRETRAAFAVLASGDSGLAADLRRMADTHRDRVSFTEGHDERLAHEILAGSDLTLVPSRYEPCGLTQLYALRYGTIPVVRATGGLADTVQHYDPATGRGTGSVFRDADPQGLLWGLRTALGWFADRTTWTQLVTNAMSADFSWQRQAAHYEDLYRSLL